MASAKRQRTQSPKAKDENKGNEKGLYAKSYSRVSKEDLYMIIALWMEDFVDDPPERYRKVGAVLVLPNDVIFAADCSRDRVHAVARLLMKHYDKAKGCKMFMSRKPCPICAKLLVQSKVQRVLFLPREPEYYHVPAPLGPEFQDADKETREKEGKKRNLPNMTLMKQVDNMFTASAIAQTRFVLKVEKAVLDDAEQKTPVKDTGKKQIIDARKVSLFREYGFEKNPAWKDSIIVENLPWPEFDTEINAHVQTCFSYAMEWIARVQILLGSGLNYNFELAKQKEYADGAEIDFEPVLNDSNDPKLKHARKFIAIARFLSERTDDPKAGVGAVIVSPKSEILAFGWNGFPLKALYGEFPRASSSDQTPDKKGPYVIHAEQNALLMRNQKDIEGSTLFVAGRYPCNECTPLIEMQGVGTVVVDTDDAHDVIALRKKENYELFPQRVKKKKFVCYRTKRTVTTIKLISS